MAATLEPGCPLQTWPGATRIPRLSEPHSLPLLYSPRYNISFCGLEKCHPFDSHKYGNIFDGLVASGHIQKGQELCPFPLAEEDMAAALTAEYRERLRSSFHLARILELPFLVVFPASLTRRMVLDKLALAASGTIAATLLAAERGYAINLGGGFHHCSREGGHGFCPLNDISMAVWALQREVQKEAVKGRGSDGRALQALRLSRELQQETGSTAAGAASTAAVSADTAAVPLQAGQARQLRVMILDLDAHQGDGHERDFYDPQGRHWVATGAGATAGAAGAVSSARRSSLARAATSTGAADSESSSSSAAAAPGSSPLVPPAVYIFDAFTPGIFPNDRPAMKAIHCRMLFREEDTGDALLTELWQKLHEALRAFQPDLVLYNAGSDILQGDPLSGLNISADAVIARDEVVFELCGFQRVQQQQSAGAGGAAAASAPAASLPAGSATGPSSYCRKFPGLMAARAAKPAAPAVSSTSFTPISMVLSGGYQQVTAAVIADSLRNLQACFGLLKPEWRMPVSLPGLSAAAGAATAAAPAPGGDAGVPAVAECASAAGSGLRSRSASALSAGAAK